MTCGSQTDFEIGAVRVSGGYLWWPDADCCGGSGTAVSSEREAPRDDWARRLDPLSIRAVKCVEEARGNAGVSGQVARPNREGVCVGSALGAQQTRVRYATRLVSHGLAGTNPIDFPDSIDGAPAAHIALRWGLQGPSLTLVGGQDCACRALVFAARQLVFGLADRMHVVVGDVFESRIGAGFSQSFGPAVEGSERAHPVAQDLVLALVLERQERPLAANAGISLVGFMNSPNEPSGLAPDESSDTSVPIRGQLDTVGILGAMAVAGTWLRLTAPNGSSSNACQDEAMRNGLRRYSLANSQWPNLAFAQTEEK